jgi:protein SCO1/2
MRKTILTALALVLPALAAAQMGPVPPPPMQATPGVLQQVGFDQKLGAQVPLDLPFRDEAGKDVKLGDYFGKKPVVLSLVYFRCPMLCTLSLNGLAGALEVLSFVPGQDFEVITVSFDPHEGPVLASAKKRAYMNRYKRSEAERGWHFLTGPQTSTEALTRAVGFRYVWDEATKQWAHPAGVLVLTPDGRLSKYLYGVEYSPKDLRLALVDAGGGKIGSFVDTVLLYCYRYDPRTGRYSMAILNLVRAGGILMIVALAGFIAVSSRRRRGGRPDARPDTR